MPVGGSLTPLVLRGLQLGDRRIEPRLEEP
jgi:hypothetical protein